MTAIEVARRLAADPTVPPLLALGAPRLGDRRPLPRTPPGRNAMYVVRRLKRDRPDVLARLLAGEFGSVAAVARAAGFFAGRRQALIDESLVERS